MKANSNAAKGFALLLLVAAAASSVSAGSLQLATILDSAQGPPGGGGGDSTTPIISPDGRFVLFASTANNLATNPIPLLVPPRMNVYLRDRLNGTTTLVSVNLSGTGGGNGDSWPSGISTNGQYALFESNASDLTPGDSNGATDVFVRDLAGGTTLLASVNTNGLPGNGASSDSMMTPDGRYVAFASLASDLTPGDTNGIADIFVRDLQAGVTVLASVGAVSTNAAAPAGGSESPDLTPDGQYVAFYSTATGLVPGAGTGGDVYVRDLGAGTTTWASAGAQAAVQAALGASQATSFNHALSADGQFVAYEASPLPTNSPVTAGLILRYSLQTGLTDLVCTNAWVTGNAGQDIADLDMTPDGRFIAFIANTNGTSGTNTCILVWDAQSGTNVLASGAPDGSVPSGSISDWPSLDPSGRYVVFLSSATNLTTNALSGEYHLYLRDLLGGTTMLADAGADGAGAGVQPATVPRFAAGPVVVFQCSDMRPAVNGGNHTSDVFVRDLAALTTELESAHNPALFSVSPNGMSLPASWALSSDNRYLVFSSEAQDLAWNDTNGCRNIFVRDLLLGTNRLASVATNGLPADGTSWQATMSADGRYVAFASLADNLVPNDTNGVADVFVYDAQSGTTTLVSVSTNSVSPGNRASSSPAISADGRYILFHSTAYNLAPVLEDGEENLFLRDMQARVTYALTTSGITSGLLPASMTRDGHYVVFSGSVNPHFFVNQLYVWNSLTAKLVYTNSLSSTVPLVAISADGQRLAFMSASTSATLYGVDWPSNQVWTIASGLAPSSHTGLRFSGDGRFLAYAAPGAFSATNQVFLYDWLDQTNLLVSRTYGGSGEANGNSDAPDLSSDGGFVAFRSTATNLVPGATNGVPAIFLYDRTNDIILPASLNPAGNGAPDNLCLAPAFSGNGAVLVFGSWASDLATNDFNGTADVFMLSLDSTAVIPLFSVQSAAGPPGQAPVISWPAMSGITYRVQFKNSLTDPAWQDLPTNPTIVGNQGYFVDQAVPGAQRFYRVSAF
jgi:Tol biopolymer transport system component